MAVGGLSCRVGAAPPSELLTIRIICNRLCGTGGFVLADLPSRHASEEVLRSCAEVRSASGGDGGRADAHCPIPRVVCVSHSIYPPRPPLDCFVEFFWTSDAYHVHTARERVLPTGAQALVVHLGGRPVEIFSDERSSLPGRFSGAVVCGARTSPLIISTSLGPIVGVHFKPGGARAFFAVPACEVSEQALSLEALWGQQARSLREQLAELSSPLERVRVLEAALLRRARPGFDRDPALAQSLRAFEEPDLSSVAEVNRRTGLSPRRLLGLFRKEVGLSPKAYWRIRRFRAALRDLTRGAASGAAVAAEHGYFDQAHFLREFRAIAGSSPREYFATEVGGTDHVALPDKNIQDSTGS